MGIANAQPGRAIRHAVRRVLERMCSEDGQLIVDVYGHRMSVPESRYLWVYASYEPYTSELFRKSVKVGDTVLDIGACFGYYSLLAAQAVGESGRIYACEPTPENYSVLLRNIEMNGLANTIIPIPKAVSNHHGSISLHLSTFGENNSLCGLPLFSRTETLAVDSITVDELVEEEPVAVVKMDLEGYEPYALDGMRRTIQKCRDLTLFTELNVECLKGVGMTPQLFLSQLDRLGFDAQLVDDEEGRLLPVTPANLVRAEVHPSRYSNLLCVKRHRM